MDPNETLGIMLDRARSILDLRDECPEDDPMADEAVELAEACLALDLWLTRGGFLPRAWERKVPTTPYSESKP
jgi:hypothetical protein